MGHTFGCLRPTVQHLSMSDYHQQCVNTPGGPIGNELDIRSLRYFVVAAEELNFTRAAARLYVAQQALSREIKRLETQLGTTLFLRTTRRVTLTPDGERLLVRARDLVARHDAVWADVHVSATQPTVVDLMSGGRLTATRIIDLARQRASSLDFRGRYTAGPGPRWRASRPAASMSCWAESTGSMRLRCQPSSRFSFGSSPWLSSTHRASVGPAGSGPCSQPEGARDRWGAAAFECSRMDRSDHAVLCAVRLPLDTTASAGHRPRGAGLPPRATGRSDPGVRRPPRGTRRRAPPPGGSDPALRLVDGVAARCRQRRDLGASRCGGRARVSG